jgi:hypothetical protein
MSGESAAWMTTAKALRNTAARAFDVAIADSEFVYRGPVFVPAGTGAAFAAQPAVGGSRGGTARRPIRPVLPVVADAPGCEFGPDPMRARTGAGLVEALREFRVWAGNVPYRVMAEQCGQLVSASTLQRALAGTALPPQKVVRAIVAGCGGTEEHQQRFVSAWRQVRGLAPGDSRSGLRAVRAAEAG